MAARSQSAAGPEATQTKLPAPARPANLPQVGPCKRSNTLGASGPRSGPEIGQFDCSSHFACWLRLSLAVAAPSKPTEAIQVAAAAANDVGHDDDPCKRPVIVLQPRCASAAPPTSLPSESNLLLVGCSSRSLLPNLLAPPSFWLARSALSLRSCTSCRLAKQWSVRWLTQIWIGFLSPGEGTEH